MTTFKEFKEELLKEGILKEESVGFLKSKFNLMQGRLYLTQTRLVLNAHKTTVNSGGIIGAVAKAIVEKPKWIFNIELTDIVKITEGKHFLRRKNILEITDKENNQ